MKLLLPGQVGQVLLVAVIVILEHQGITVLPMVPSFFIVLAIDEYSFAGSNSYYLLAANAPSPYLPSTPGGQPMTPNSASYLPGTPGGQPMTPGTGGLDVMSPVIGN